MEVKTGCCQSDILVDKNQLPVYISLICSVSTYFQFVIYIIVQHVIIMFTFKYNPIAMMFPTRRAV